MNIQEVVNRLTNTDHKQHGFTLIELLVVMGIISTLAAVVFVALNPAERFADARDSRRWSDVNSLLTALHECIVDNDGSLSSCGLSTSLAESQLGSSGSGCDDDTCGAVAACLDLSTPLAAYLKSIPIDPNLADTATETHYSVSVDTNNIVTISACSSEGGPIEVSR